MKATKKAFLEALLTMGQQPLKAKALTRDHRLTQSERAVITGFLLLRENKFDEIFELLGRFQSWEPEVEAQKNFLEAATFNDQGDCSKAVERFQLAITQMEQFPDFQKQKYRAYYGLFVAYRNLKNLEGMKAALHSLESMPIETVNDELMIERSRVNVLCFEERYDEAQSRLLGLSKHLPHMNELHRWSYHMDIFDLAIKRDDLDRASDILRELKGIRIYGWTVNYKFMKSLLENLRTNAPIYLYKKTFEKTPLLLHQVGVLLELEEGNRESARHHWQSLRQMAPETYREDFIFNGDICLFSKCFSKLLNRSSAPTIEIDKYQGLGKIEVLISILRDSKTPVDKRILVETLWGHPAKDKRDFERLASLVRLARRKYNAEIDYRKGHYQLVISEKLPA